MRRRNTYSCNVIAVCFKTAHMIQRLHQLEQATTEQLVARRQAAQALIGAQGGITQLSQTSQQEQVSGQVIDTRVFGKRDKWDGSEKAWPNWSFVDEDSYAGAIDQQLSDDMTKAEISTTVLENGSMPPEAQAWSCAVVLNPDHAVHWKSLGSHRQCAAHGWGMDLWRLLFSTRTPRRTTRGWS